MIPQTIFPNRRKKKRQNADFEISLPNQVKGRTKNVSANGAYFEVLTDNIDEFCPEKMIPLTMTTTYKTHDFKVIKLCLSGKGLIIYRDVVEETTGKGIKLNIAVRFMEKLNLWMPSNN